MITIGNHYQGPELDGSLIKLALRTALGVAEEERDEEYDSGKEAFINPIFIVPGSISKPDFEGFKYGYFSKKEKGVVIQIAVPQSVADGEGIREFIVGALREAVRMAAEKFAKHAIPFSSLKAEKIILAIEKKLQGF
ncbi:hypothetical protein ACR71G_20475 [Xenorhabdus bovienii]|uniref:Uncharacterized protein n=1 Tax=Xenorhabdus bovienii str. kraussei Becker Underwood TaxID=1398204 RepID=A0A077PR35_XENBV|nr:hypothetical protein [Xenorhabdus bovienii]CDH22374.1 hypothetical protein XBKB1_1110011 [Xenorhabdus bovienii str. kraussei Becker Underwood]